MHDQGYIDMGELRRKAARIKKDADEAEGRTWRKIGLAEFEVWVKGRSTVQAQGHYSRLIPGLPEPVFALEFDDGTMVAPVPDKVYWVFP